MQNTLWSKIIISLVILFFLGLAPLVSYAGNPLYMNTQGQPLVWDTTQTIRYKLDPKNLGTLTFDQARVMIEEAMAVWESVSGTNIQFQYLGPLSTPITLDNWKEIAGNQIYAAAYGVIPKGTTPSQTEGYIVIGFDNDGSIIADKGSAGASGVQSLTGVTGTLEKPAFIKSSHIFLNGLYINGKDDDISDLSVVDMMAIVVHELGHALGLDHSIFHYEIYSKIRSGTLDPSYARYLPSMFPRFLKTTGQHMITLHPDEIATLKWMYGAPDYNLASGTVFDSDMNPQSTLVVTARQTNSSLCQSYAQATSITCSDMNTQEDGEGSNFFNGKNCLDENSFGDYTIPILENGYYTLDVQSIPEFLSSSISKFASKTQSISGGAEFYNLDDDNNEDGFVYDEILIDGADQADLDIVLSDSEGELDRIDYTYFQTDTFFNTVQDDIYCPIDPDYDADGIILGTESTFTEDLSNSSINQDLSASSCSLVSSQTGNNQVMTSFLGSLVLLWGISRLRLECL